MNALDVLKVVVDRYPGPGMAMVGQDTLARVEAVVEAARDIAAYAVKSHEGPYNLVRVDELEPLDAALAALDTDPEAA